MPALKNWRFEKDAFEKNGALRKLRFEKNAF
jgi:hypothetical protein